MRGGPGARGGGHQGRGPFGPDRRGGFGGGGWGGGGRMRRGDIRRAILATLREEPGHGYAIISRLEELSGGMWRPSPGSIYPQLAQLEHDGIVQSEEVDGVRTFSLTEAGLAEAAVVSPFPWQDDEMGTDQVRGLRNSIAPLINAAKQLSTVGTADQISRGLEAIHKARKEIYKILAED
jgi:DNA-binding PadR family transcriptional regulator